MKRARQVLLIASLFPLCWLAMMLVHEMGHVLAGWLSGGAIKKLVVHPLSISRTDVSPNPSPLLVVWAGPLFGVLFPLSAWGFARWLRLPADYLVKFFAGFCLIANGAYIGIGSFEEIGDAGVMLKHGSAGWHLWMFGVATVPVGLWLWHGLGPKFGLGESKGQVEPKDAVAVFALLCAFVVLTSVFSSRN